MGGHRCLVGRQYVRTKVWAPFERAVSVGTKGVLQNADFAMQHIVRRQSWQ
jgi:hypothetical protein